MSLFRLDASIRVEGSHSRAIADIVEQEWRNAHPGEPGTPRQGWDHATGWMRRVLADVWHLDLKVVEAEFTLVGVNPALDQFTDLARELRRETEEQARRHGRELGAAVAAAPPKAA